MRARGEFVVEETKIVCVANGIVENLEFTHVNGEMRQGIEQANVGMKHFKLEIAMETNKNNFNTKSVQTDGFG